MLLGIDASRANRSQRTGVENYAFNLIEELKKIIPGEIQVVLYTDCLLNQEWSALPANWRVKVLVWPPKRFWTQIRLSLEMLFHPPDVLFISAHVFPLIHPRKTVMTIHDVAAIKFPESYSWFERWYSVFSAKMAVRKLWKVIVPSQFVKEELLSQKSKVKSQKFESQKIKDLRLKIDEKICVINHGYDERFRKYGDKEIMEIEEILQKYNLTKPFIMSVGRLEEKKNTRRIIEAFEILKYSIFNIQLFLVGKPGYGFESVKVKIDESGFKKDILVPGFVSAEDLPLLLNAAEVFVFPSLYEGFGLPVLEAMACGCPVVASWGNSLEEVGGSAAIYVDAFDSNQIASAVNSLLADQNLRLQKIALGLERVKLFSWEKCAIETANVLLYSPPTRGS